MQPKKQRLNIFFTGFFVWTLLLLSACTSQKQTAFKPNFEIAQAPASPKNIIAEAPQHKTHISTAPKIPSVKNNKLVNSFTKLENKISAKVNSSVQKIQQTQTIVNYLPRLQKSTVKKKPVWQITWKDVIFFIVLLLLLSALVVIARALGVGPFVYLLGAALLTVLVIGIYVYYNNHLSYPKY